MFACWSSVYTLLLLQLISLNMRTRLRVSGEAQLRMRSSAMNYWRSLEICNLISSWLKWSAVNCVSYNSLPGRQCNCVKAKWLYRQVLIKNYVGCSSRVLGILGHTNFVAHKYFVIICATAGRSSLLSCIFTRPPCRCGHTFDASIT